MHSDPVVLAPALANRSELNSSDARFSSVHRGPRAWRTSSNASALPSPATAVSRGRRVPHSGRASTNLFSSASTKAARPDSAESATSSAGSGTDSAAQSTRSSRPRLKARLATESASSGCPSSASRDTPCSSSRRTTSRTSPFLSLRDRRSTGRRWRETTSNSRMERTRPVWPPRIAPLRITLASRLEGAPRGSPLGSRPAPAGSGVSPVHMRAFRMRSLPISAASCRQKPSNGRPSPRLTIHSTASASWFATLWRSAWATSRRLNPIVRQISGWSQGTLPPGRTPRSGTPRGRPQAARNASHQTPASDTAPTCSSSASFWGLGLGVHRASASSGARRRC
mmetsp:Transcript_17294/g.41318  ORF Transcript_17294/g.41318 Transcript_17294/m.41318 type:complete len:340 (-) Transcript_17294:3213-4232(-)